MPLVEQDSSRHILACARRIDHHQRMVGDDDVGLAARPLGAFDEATAIVWAAGIDALAAAIGQRGRSGTPEQAWQPARQVAANHVAVLGVCRPAPDQLREHRGSPGERSLQRVLEVEEAEIILAPLANDDLPRSLLGVGEQLRAFGVELALQRLGEGRNPHRAAGLLGPQRCGREICKRLADPGSSFSEHHVGRALRALWSEDLGHCFGHRLLTLARLCAAGERIELAPRLAGSTVWFAAAAARPLPPIASAAKTAFARRVRAARDVHRSAAPSPSRAGEESRSKSTHLRARASRVVEHRKQARRRCAGAQRAAPESLPGGSSPSVRLRPAARRHRKFRRMDEREQLEQVEPAQLRIAEPLSDQRRIEDDVRSLRCPRDRLAPGRLAQFSLAAHRARFRRGLRGAREEAKEPPSTDPAAREQKSNGFGRRQYFVLPQ